MENKKTLSILALIFGLLGIILTFTPASVVGLILAILGIIFAIVAKKKEGKSGMVTAGLVLSIIALVLWIIVIVFAGLIFGTFMMGAAALLS
ncbi:hypothetical protein LJC56_06905 [Christensenellaceae bacterium OttesenSCG-928-K19]|nr:hypothetical protein [Christensenellaceae bacterium OttesenSCG-928-K19]